MTTQQRTIRTLIGLAIVAAGCAKTSSGNSDSGFATTDAATVDAGKPDAGKIDGGDGLTCGALLTCDQNCGSSNSCTNNCYAGSTANAQNLFNAFDNCLNSSCSSADGGPCANSNSTECSNCNQSSATGACISNLESCEQDNKSGPPSADGGSVSTDGGMTYNCGQLLTCESNCAANDNACVSACAAMSTMQAQSLLVPLTDCLAMACPSTDGGPCAMPGLTCNGCIEQVTLAEPNTCAAQYIQCNCDTSNGSAGCSATPASFIDGGVISTVVTDLDQCASTMVAGGGYLYFTQVIGDSPVLRLTLTDGGVQAGVDGGEITPLGPPEPTPVSLALDSNNVYVWSVGSFQLASSINNKDGTVVQVPLNGGTAITLAQNMEVLYDAAYLNAVTIDTHNVYWVAGANGNDGAIMKTPIGGGSTPVALYSNQYVPQAVVSDGTNLYWADWGTFDSQGRANNDGTLWQGSVNGGTPKMLASNQPAPSAIVVDSSTVYWTNLGPLGGDNLPALNSGSVMKTPIGGGTVSTIASSQAVPVAIILSGGTLYWSQYGLNTPGLIMKAPAAGGAATPILSGLDDPAELVVSGNTLYWTNANSSPTNGFISALSPF